MFEVKTYRISPRIGILVGMAIFFLNYLLTYPWPFLSGSIPYLHPVEIPTTSNSTSSNSTIEYVGCPLDHKWCASTPRVNVIVCYGATIITVGFGYPLIGISLDILFSKILGPIQQGTMQGIYGGAGVGLQILGPIFLT